MSEYHEAIIIGGGPAGLTAGIYLMRAGIDTLLVEKVLPGGTPLNTGRIENYPGFAHGISGKELMDRFAEHAKTFGLPVREFAQVESLSREEKGFVMKTSSGLFESMGIIVANGTESLKLNIPGEKELVGRGISYCATCDGMFFKDLNVAVIGGGDAAVEEGLLLANIAKKVYIVHRRDTLRAQKILCDRAFKNDRIEFLWNKKPVEIAGKDQVEYALIEDTKTGERSRLEVSGVFIYVGAAPDTAFLRELTEQDKAGFIVTDQELSTRTEGLFAAGDVRKKTLRQITTAVGDGALAAVNLEKYILEKKL
ncbi:MAG TPA: thioredoxin-disulfide reductase [Syntrophorhabdaceae bacterium]|nr:thioredoxin-disulfide reductase [Syntrophorhabdaceae bacterium]